MFHITHQAAQAVIARHGHGETARLEWAQHFLGCERLAAYMAPKSLFRHPGAFVYNCVGGVDLDAREPAFRAEVLDTLRAADHVAVRDLVTLDCLGRNGIAANLAPDPAAMAAQLFGQRISSRHKSGEVATVRVC